MKKPILDKYDQVINGPDTYDAIAAELATNACCIIAWTDQKDTHFDILFTVSPKSFGFLQGGIRGYGYMYISIMRRGCFAFNIDIEVDLFPAYIGEKLGEPRGPSADALTELINGVMREIRSV